MISSALVLTLLAAVGAHAKSSNNIPLSRRPLSITKPDGSVSLESLQVEVSNVVSKIERNNRVARSRAVKGHRRALVERGAVPLAYTGDLLWSGAVSVGYPRQTLQVYFDTGSADFIVADSACSQTQCGDMTRYNASASTTAVNTKAVSTTNFVDGSSVRGTVIKDTVSAGAIAVNQQAIVSSTALSSTVTSLNADALMGLAFPALNSRGESSLPFTMVDQGVSAGMFGLALSKDAGKSGLWFNGYDRRKVAGTIRWYSVARSSNSAPLTYWQVAGTSAVVNGVKASDYVNMILDSGTSLIMAPPAAAAAFWAAVPGSQPFDGNYWTFPCNTVPTVAFQFTRTRAAYQFEVNADNLNLGYLPGDRSRCVGSIVGVDLGLGSSWILGDSFLLGWYTIYDAKLNRIGVAPLR